MKLIQDAQCSVKGTIHAKQGDQVALINLYGHIAIVRDVNGERFPVPYALLTCPMAPADHKPLQPRPTPQDPIKTKKTISNRSRDVSQDPQTTLF